MCFDNLQEEPNRLCWEDNTGYRYELAFGYVKNNPVAALFIGENTLPTVLIPREILGIGFSQGWPSND